MKKKTLPNSGEFFAAAKKGDIEKVSTFLEAGIDPNLRVADKTALLEASKEGHLEIVKLLLEKGADMYASSDTHGFTALHMASKRGHLEVVKLLLKKRYPWNFEVSKTGVGFTMLKFSSKTNSPQSQFPFDMETQDNTNGYTALHMASNEGHFEVVKFLLEKGADINIQSWACGTALQMACKAGHLKVVKLLIEKGADIKVKNRE